jgi:hypothetical protein
LDLDFCEAVPSPDKAARVRETTVAPIFKSYRLRRFDAALVISKLRNPASLTARLDEPGHRQGAA